MSGMLAIKDFCRHTICKIMGKRFLTTSHGECHTLTRFHMHTQTHTHRPEAEGVTEREGERGEYGGAGDCNLALG